MRILYLTVDKDGIEKYYICPPYRDRENGVWISSQSPIFLSTGTIEYIIGDPINWSYAPVEILQSIFDAEKVKIK